VIEFYKHEEVSKQCPGMKEYISARVGGGRFPKPKTLIICEYETKAWVGFP